jgi:hypothetical protein
MADYGMLQTASDIESNLESVLSKLSRFTSGDVVDRTAHAIDPGKIHLNYSDPGYQFKTYYLFQCFH